MNIPKEIELDSPKKKGLLYLNKHYPEFTKYLQQKYPHVNKFCAAVYLYYNNMEHPLCPMCGKPTPFLDSTRGFQRYCSSKCANSDPSFREKVEQTCLKKYGARTPSQNNDIKQKVIQTTIERHGGMGNAAESTKLKQFETMKNKYGSEHALQNDSLLNKAVSTCIERHGGVGSGSKNIADKITKTNLERYGVENIFSSKVVRDKITKTNLERYGVPVPTMNPTISEKISTSKNANYSWTHRDSILEIFKEGKEVIYKCKCPHPECTICQEKTYTINAKRYCDRRLDGTEPCTNLVPVLSGRNKGTSLEMFIYNIVSECTDKSTLLTNYRGLIPPKEIDLYDPLHGLAFESNGCYWHSDLKKSSTYHKIKHEECEKNGVQLISIWEDWIRNKPEIVKSIIRAKYHYFERIIYARECKISIINGTDAAKFYDTNHIQGSTRAKIHYGLFHNNELVACMSFSPIRPCMGSKVIKEDEWELSRFCNKINISVVGGANKLLKNFIKSESPKSVISFSSNDISNGSLYEKLGFIKDRTNTSYWYIGQDYKRYHRSSFTKSSIREKGMAPDSEHWTETEVMMQHGFVRIYDSGQTKWVLRLE